MSKLTRFLPSSRVILFATCFLSLANFFNLNYRRPESSELHTAREFVPLEVRPNVVEESPPATQKPIRLYQIQPDDIYIYSAFVDRRFNHHNVRMLGIQHEDASKRLLCHFNINRNLISEVAVKENYLIFGDWPSPKLRYMARMYACPLPDGLQPAQIEVSVDGSNVSGLVLPIVSVGGVEGGRQDLAVCVKGIWGSLDANKLIEWLEFNRLLGVQKVVFYDVMLTGEAVKVVEHYAQSGFVTIERFDFAQKMTRLFDEDPLNSHLRGSNLSQEQAYLVSMNDCYYTQRNHFKYVMILDVDEVIVPMRSTESLHDVIEAANVEFPNAASFNFHTAWHLGDYGMTSASDDEPLFMQRNLRRSEVTRSQPKAIINTDRAITVNWHGTVTVPSHRSLIGNVFLPWQRYGYVHHFRRKCKHAPDKCKEMLRTHSTDDVIPRYKSRLSNAVNNVLTELELRYSHI
ncbi:hypothetical protein CAPTEDRAFT_219582 [Capitella teleta]|uniref:Glycosyltransferase family 92 protein n=1 Tax=Capitella teleta TaxID=283909 RepID=R7UDE8_CAPTE|nr:hypothetical protein CAPTEDRAFT_219582 [Capitella teleta]|eukprot:ELU04131.1 hypothetical protein CAPTEDRAFT_219582 [Capitella teleta]